MAVYLRRMAVYLRRMAIDLRHMAVYLRRIGVPLGWGWLFSWVVKCPQGEPNPLGSKMPAGKGRRLGPAAPS